MNRTRKAITAALVAAFVLVAGARAVSAEPLDPSVGDIAPGITTTTTAPVLNLQTPAKDDSSPGMFDVSGRVRQAIDDWFGSLVTSAITPALELLGRVLLSAPDLTDQPDVRAVWLISLGIADALFVVLALVGGVTIMTHETVQTRYSVKEIAPRLVIAVISTNVSLLIISQAITLANALAQGFLGSGVDSAQAVAGLGKAVLDPVNGGGFLMLLALVATAMTLVLVCIGLLRALLVILLIVSAPLALACHALPQTDQFASLWWRSLVACLSIQIAQALVLVTAVRVFFVSDGSNVVGATGGGGLVTLLITLCVFWLMIKIPVWAEQMVFSRGGGPVNASQQKIWTAAKLAVKFA